jgi:hypothetical protein
MLAVVGLLVVQLVVASPEEDVEGLRRSLRAFGEGERDAADLRCARGDAASCATILQHMHFEEEEMWAHCAQPVLPTRMERRKRRLRDSSVQEAVGRLRECGFVRISRAVEPAAAQELLVSAYEYVGEEPDALYSLRNAVGEGSRVEFMLPFASPFNESALHASPLFFPVVRALPAPTSRCEAPPGPDALLAAPCCWRRAGEKADGGPQYRHRGRHVPHHQNYRARSTPTLRRAAVARAHGGGHHSGR